MPLSGSYWITQYPNSTSIEDLAEPFLSNVRKFLSALQSAGASVTIGSTLRPRQRAHLMHYSFLVSGSSIHPADVPSCAGVDIEWVHLDLHGKPDLGASQSAAREMVHGYEIVYAPALESKHTVGHAIDMDISWKANLAIVDGQGRLVSITTVPRTGANAELQAVAATYGVLKLISDPPHWSIDGH